VSYGWAYMSVIICRDSAACLLESLPTRRASGDLLRRRIWSTTISATIPAHSFPIFDLVF
jgi:hypothetical protein